MSSDLIDVLLLALVSMFNPTLLAVTTLMIFFDNPRRLMLGYLLGAYLTSIGLGLLIVFELSDSGAVETTQNTLSPASDLVLGGLILIVAIALKGERGTAMRERRAQRKEQKVASGEKKESLPQRLLGRGSARLAFVVGIFLSFPGASYLAGLGHIASLDPGTAAAIGLVVGFCLIQLALLEVPLLGYALSPVSTQERVVRFRDWLGANGYRVGMQVAAVIGALLIVRGVVTLL
ncbi:MAG: GAP family protein [Solirubrobacterales bacterium]